MKKLLPIVVILLIALAGGWFLLGRGGKTGDESGTVITSEGEEEKGYTGNLEKIMGLGIPLKCTWKRDNDYYGSAWIKGSSSYSEIATQGKKVSVIYKDNCMWSWEEGNAQGMKMCFDPSEAEVVEGGPMGSADQMKPPSDLDYKCLPAVFTDSKFNPPGGINFMDIDEMMMGGGMGE